MSGFYLLSLAFTRMNPAIITKVMPVMPLTSLSDNGIPGWPQVTRRASTAKIRANIKTSNPATMLFHWNTFMDDIFTSFFAYSFFSSRFVRVLLPFRQYFFTHARALLDTHFYQHSGSHSLLILVYQLFQKATGSVGLHPQLPSFLARAHRRMSVSILGQSACPQISVDCFVYSRTITLDLMCALYEFFDFLLKDFSRWESEG